MRIGKLATTKQNPFGIKWGAPKTPPPVPPKDAQPAAPAARQASAPARPATGEGPSALASRAPEKALPPLPEATAPHYASSTAPWVNDTATIRPGEAGGHALNRGFGQLLEGSAPMDHAAPAAAQDEPIVLLLDQNAIAVNKQPNYFVSADINANIASVGVRDPLPYFMKHEGQNVVLPGGPAGREGWFATGPMPAPRLSAESQGLAAATPR